MLIATFSPLKGQLLSFQSQSTPVITGQLLSLISEAPVVSINEHRSPRTLDHRRFAKRSFGQTLSCKRRTASSFSAEFR